MKKIFFAWQSQDGAFSKKVSEALQLAIDEINKEGAFEELRLDKDTYGNPGIPSIPDTVRQKIAECDIFVGDISLVIEAGGNKKYPNWNVGFELGMALQRLGVESILLVMNRESGRCSDLPFDISSHRVELVSPNVSDIRNKMVARIKECLKFQSKETSDRQLISRHDVGHELSPLEGALLQYLYGRDGEEKSITVAYEIDGIELYDKYGDSDIEWGNRIIEQKRKPEIAANLESLCDVGYLSSKSIGNKGMAMIYRLAKKGYDFNQVNL